MIKNGGFPYNVFCTLYHACVCSIADYGAEIYGFDKHESAHKIHLRAARSFLGVNKTTPIIGIISEFNLLLPQYRGQLRMVRQYHRVLKCSENITAKKIFIWDKNLTLKIKFNLGNLKLRLFSLKMTCRIFLNLETFSLSKRP